MKLILDNVLRFPPWNQISLLSLRSSTTSIIYYSFLSSLPHNLFPTLNSEFSLFSLFYFSLFFLLPFSLIFPSFFHFPHFKNKESTKVLNSQFFVLKHIFRSPEPAYKVSAIGVCLCLSTKYAQIIENGTYKNYEIEKRFEFWYVAFKYDKDAAQNF